MKWTKGTGALGCLEEEGLEGLGSHGLVRSGWNEAGGSSSQTPIKISHLRAPLCQWPLTHGRVIAQPAGVLETPPFSVAGRRD